MSPDPGRNRRAHGATGTDLGAQVHVGTLEVHYAGGARKRELPLVLNKKIAPRRARESTTYGDHSSGLTTVPVDDHAPGKKSIRDKDTGGQNRAGDADIAAQGAAEARVVSISEIRGRVLQRGTRGSPGVRAGGAPGLAGRKHSGGDGGRPQVTSLGEGKFNLLEGGGEANIEDEVSKATARPGALDGPGNISPAVDDEPGVGVRLRDERRAPRWLSPR